MGLINVGLDTFDGRNQGIASWFLCGGAFLWRSSGLYWHTVDQSRWIVTWAIQTSCHMVVMVGELVHSGGFELTSTLVLRRRAVQLCRVPDFQRLPVPSRVQKENPTKLPGSGLNVGFTRVTWLCRP